MLRRWSLVGLAAGLACAAGTGLAHPQAQPPPPYAGRDPELSGRSRPAPAAGSGAAQAGSLSADEARADRDLRAEQLRAARELYELFPRTHAAFVLGMVANEQGDTDAAIRYWREEARLAEGLVSRLDRAEACANLGDALQVKGQYEEATAMLQEALRLNPRRPETAFRLAHLLGLQGRTDECLKALDEARLETPQAWGLRGQVAQRQGRLADARRHFEAAIRADPKFAEGHYGLAMTCAQTGDEARAAEARQRFSALKAEHQTTGRQLRADYAPLAISRRSFAQTHTHVGWVYLAQGRADLAERTWRRAAAVDPDNTAARFQLIMLYQKARRNEEALQFCREMIRAEPANGWHYLGLGNLLVRLQRAPEAEQAFRQAVDLAPARPEGYFALAQFYVQAGTNATAATALARKAVELAPLAPHYFILARALRQQGNLPEARAAAARACELEPANPQYRELLTRLGAPP